MQYQRTSSTHQTEKVASKNFRVLEIMEALREHFAHCWKPLKASSHTLEFNDSISGDFNREFQQEFSRRNRTA